MNKKMFLTAAAVIAGAFAFAPTAIAQAIITSPAGGTILNEKASRNGPENAAAAIYVTYQMGTQMVSTLSAASAFGEAGAATSADSNGARSVSSSGEAGSILAIGQNRQSPFPQGSYVNFGTSDIRLDEGGFRAEDSNRMPVFPW